MKKEMTTFMNQEITRKFTTKMKFVAIAIGACTLLSGCELIVRFDESKLMDVTALDVPRTPTDTGADVPTMNNDAVDVPSMADDAADVPNNDVPNNDVPNNDVPNNDVPNNDVPNAPVDVPNNDVPNPIDVPNPVDVPDDVPNAPIDVVDEG